MNFPVATKNFEKWLVRQVRLVQRDLAHKHAAMRVDPFSFLRATYYRWAQQFDGLEAVTSHAPVVLSVGDLHIENFGTWRDALGRLAWGINDFDEAYPLPYTNDLVRLAVSVLIARDLEHLSISAKAACEAILEGYRQAFETSGKPFIIGDEHRWLKPVLSNSARDPGPFWDRLRKLPRDRRAPPAEALAAIRAVMPDEHLHLEMHHRIAGLGNLGKPRYTAIAQWMGGPVARESKTVTLSAAAWAQSKTDGPYYGNILSRAIRSPDPYLKVQGGYVSRRLAPDCGNIELAALRIVEDEEWLLHAMGFETANVHLGSPAARSAIKRHLAKYTRKQFKEAATTMLHALEKDFLIWRKDGL